MVNTTNCELILTIVTEDNEGDVYVINASTIKEVLDDWNGERAFVPNDDARVFFVEYAGKPVSPYEYGNFGSLMAYFVWLTQKYDVK